jgi:hypothetical protein
MPFVGITFIQSLIKICHFILKLLGVARQMGTWTWWYHTPLSPHKMRKVGWNMKHTLLNLSIWGFHGSVSSECGHVDFWLHTSVSEEHTTSIFNLKCLKMKAVFSSDMLATTYKTTWHHIQSRRPQMTPSPPWQPQISTKCCLNNYKDKVT